MVCCLSFDSLAPALTLLFRVNAVSFPHYFLQATGHLEEQLKTREWIVARITSIAEHVVDANVSRRSCPWKQAPLILY
jgi:hypothetical protein